MSGIVTSVLLAAIAAVESGNNPNAHGKAGEIGAHQMLPENAARRTPEEHVEFLALALERHNIAVTPRTIAWAWNGGPGAVISGRMSPATYDYGLRVEAVYEKFCSQSKDLNSGVTAASQRGGVPPAQSLIRPGKSPLTAGLSITTPYGARTTGEDERWLQNISFP